MENVIHVKINAQSTEGSLMRNAQFAIPKGKVVESFCLLFYNYLYLLCDKI